MCPSRSSRAKKSGTGRKRSVRSPNSPRASTSASSSGAPTSGPLVCAKVQPLPRHDLLPRTHQRLPELSPRPGSRRVSSTSTRPCRNSREAGLCGLSRCARLPLRCPNSRAGSTRVSLKTTRSELPQQRRKLAENRVLEACLPFRCNIREAARSAGGCCAISSGGSEEIEIGNQHGNIIVSAKD